MKEIKTFDIYVLYNTKWNEYRMYIYSYITDEYFLFIGEHGIQITKSQFNYEIDESKFNQFILDTCLILNCSDFSEVINHV